MLLWAGGPSEGVVADGEQDHRMEMGYLPWMQPSCHPGKDHCSDAGSTRPCPEGCWRSFAVLKVVGSISFFNGGDLIIRDMKWKRLLPPEDRTQELGQAQRQLCYFSLMNV